MAQWVSGQGQHTGIDAGNQCSRPTM